MALIPHGGLGRLLLAILIISTIAYLVLNIVSFAGARWITYNDTPVRFGLWKVCDTRFSGLCNLWSDDQYATMYTNGTFHGDKPGFIRTSQALEIISLIFYIVAAVFIIIGLIDLPGFRFELAFAVAAVLLFICIVFLSATLGVMSVKGRSGHSGFLDWAWWNGLVGLIMTIIAFFALIFLIIYMNTSASSATRRTPSRNQKGVVHQNVWSHPDAHQMGMVGGGALPAVVPHFPTYQQPQYLQQNLYPQQSHYPDYNQYGQQNPSDHYWQQQQHTNQYPQNAMLAYGDQSPAEQYYHQSPSPIISELARQYVNQAQDTQYQRQLLDPYKQYLQDPYLIQNYL